MERHYLFLLFSFFSFAVCGTGTCDYLEEDENNDQTLEYFEGHSLMTYLSQVQFLGKSLTDHMDAFLERKGHPCESADDNSTPNKSCTLSQRDYWSGNFSDEELQLKLVEEIAMFYLEGLLNSTGGAGLLPRLIPHLCHFADGFMYAVLNKTQDADVLEDLSCLFQKSFCNALAMSEVCEARFKTGVKAVLSGALEKTKHSLNCSITSRLFSEYCNSTNHTCPPGDDPFLQQFLSEHMTFPKLHEPIDISLPNITSVYCLTCRIVWNFFKMIVSTCPVKRLAFFFLQHLAIQGLNGTELDVVVANGICVNEPNFVVILQNKTATEFCKLITIC